MPALDGLSIGGGSQAQIDGVAADNLDIALSGGAGLAATGQATDVTLEASGGAQADLSRLDVKTMRVVLSEGATADVSVSDLLTGTASGGAAAKVAGAAILDVQTSGGASVTRH